MKNIQMFADVKSISYLSSAETRNTKTHAACLLHSHKPTNNLSSLGEYYTIICIS